VLILSLRKKDGSWSEGGGEGGRVRVGRVIEPNQGERKGKGERCVGQLVVLKKAWARDKFPKKVYRKNFAVGVKNIKKRAPRNQEGKTS